ncbi:unnamed protein product [Pipistrellus nathusii]|uniref:Membrane-spanning 4-domains subfamily A member 8 n=1 Tax=Pipistrellus nathusii TaxID=59473 RepID=A0ABP0ALA3_PIPNA
MNSMTSADPKANTVFVAAPHNGQPVIPGNMSQVPQYPLNQPQVHIISGNPPSLEPPVYMQFDHRSFKEGKVLGAIQILNGLIHIGLGTILGTFIAGRYTPISFLGGYPFWGGILFIIAGSLSVASEELPRSSCLLNGSLGLNIISAICSVVGILLFITELIVNPLGYYHSNDIYWGLVPGIITTVVLLIFSLLEFCIACTAAHFGFQLLRQAQNRGPVVFQTVYANAGPMNVPPYHVNVVQASG